MTRNVAVEHIDDGACIITGRHSQLDYHEPGDFRRSRDPGSHLEPTKRVLVWRRFHDLITFRGWRDELKDGRYRCWDDEQEPVRNVPVRLDERLGCMVADWKDEKTAQAIAAWIPAAGMPSFAELRESLVDCSDEALGQICDQVDLYAERCYMLCCLGVAILRERYRLEEWPGKSPEWWHENASYPPDEQPFAGLAAVAGSFRRPRLRWNFVSGRSGDRNRPNRGLPVDTWYTRRLAC